MSVENKAIEEVSVAIKALRDAHEDSANRTEGELKAMREKVEPAIKAFEDFKAEAEKKAAEDKARIETLEKMAAKGNASGEVDTKAAVQHCLGEMIKSSRDPVSLKSRSVTDPQAGGILVEPTLIDSLLLTYMKDEAPMFREANIMTQAGTAGISFIRKQLIFGAKAAGEKQASRGKTERVLSRENINMSRYYSKDSATEEFLTGQMKEGDSAILQDIMSDLGYSIQWDMLRGDGNNSKPRGLLNEKFLIDSAFETEGTSGQLTWTDLFKVRKQFNFERYRDNGKYYMTYDILLQFIVEKDNDGSPIWQPGVNGVMQSTIAGRPYVIMPGMDETVAANTLPVLYGDMRRAYIGLVSTDYKTYRDENTNQELGMVDYAISTFAGGAPHDEEAIRAIKGK